MSEPAQKCENNCAIFKQNYLYSIPMFIGLKMAYSCCFGVREILDFSRFPSKISFITSTIRLPPNSPAQLPSCVRLFPVWWTRRILFQSWRPTSSSAQTPWWTSSCPPLEPKVEIFAFPQLRSKLGLKKYVFYDDVSQQLHNPIRFLFFVIRPSLK